MRRTALCLALAAAPALGGCTLTLGLTGGLIDNASMRRPGTRYTLEAPPPLDTPVELLLRNGDVVVGAWRGSEEAVQTTATATAPAIVQSVVVLHGHRGQPLRVPEANVARIRARPRRSNALVPMMLIGLAIDGGLAAMIHHVAQCFGGCDSNDGY